MSANGTQPDWIRSIHLQYFTAFEDISIEFSPGINFIIGENGTGKTHLLKVMYAVCQYDADQFAGELFYTFLGRYFDANPRGKTKGGWNLINFHATPDNIGYRRSKIILQRTSEEFTSELHEVNGAFGGVGSTTLPHQSVSVFIPAKEMLSHNKWFVASYEKRHLAFEKHYYDILVNASAAPLLEQKLWQLDLLNKIAKIIGGPILEMNEFYYVDTTHGPLEFTLVAEGHRKLALYWLLLNNGMLDEGSILFIDEPEANLNPRLMGDMVEILLELSRHGIQIFVASHSFVMFKALEQRRLETDRLRFHALYRDPGQDGKICAESHDNPLDLVHDPILDAYNELYDRDIEAISSRIRKVT